MDAPLAYGTLDSKLCPIHMFGKPSRLLQVSSSSLLLLLELADIENKGEESNYIPWALGIYYVTLILLLSRVTYIKKIKPIQVTFSKKGTKMLLQS